MAKNLDNAFGPNHLEGSKHVFERDAEPRSLNSHIRSILVREAQLRVAQSNPGLITDSSGGTATVQYTQVDSGPFSSNDLTSLTTGVLEGSFDTSADTVMDAYAVLLERLNDEVFSQLGAGDADEGPGTIAASGTVAAVDVVVAANTGDTDAVTVASGRAAQADILHAQRMVIQAIDDAKVMVGQARLFQKRQGRWDKVGDLTFADDDPDTITRASGSWIDDGFMPGDVVRSSNSELNDGDFTVETMTALILTLVSTDELAAEVITAATEGLTYDLVTAQPRTFPGRLEGADALDIDGVPSPGGSVWDLVFETGTSDITNAADNDILTSILKTEVDLFFQEMRDNIALMVEQVDDILAPEVDAGIVSVQIPYFIPQTEYAAGTSVFVVSPVSGRIRTNRTIVMDEVTAGEGTITLEINGSAVAGASVTVVTGAIIGEFDVDAVADSGVPGGATGNFVAKGQRIEIVSDGTPTAGAIRGEIEVEETGETDDNLSGYVA